MKRTKKQIAMFVTGCIMMLAGLSVLGFYGVRHILRDIHRNQLMKENMVIQIPELRIKAPVLEGTDNEVLKQAVGHFPETGTPGHGNCCIAGHSSPIYKEYFNAIRDVQMGMKIHLYDVQKHEYVYTVTEYRIVEPNETWVLQDFGDDRVTIVTCTDDGSQRQIVVGQLDNPTNQ